MTILSKVETRRDSSARIALNCFQSIAYVFECNAVKMTEDLLWFIVSEIFYFKVRSLQQCSQLKFHFF